MFCSALLFCSAVALFVTAFMPQGAAAHPFETAPQSSMLAQFPTMDGCRYIFLGVVLLMILIYMFTIVSVQF